MIESFENRGDLTYYLVPRTGMTMTDASDDIGAKRIAEMLRAPLMPEQQPGTTDGELQTQNSQPLTIRNFEPRIYQQTILATCVQKNMLVVLPTGLGKTSIALMLALQRLKSFPTSKILFLAPTRPLAEQHKASFLKYSTLPEKDMTVFTGFVKPEKREQLWKASTIIFSTPQGVENDIINERISLKDVCLLIFDECHRATGNYTYKFIAEQYIKKASYPKILGLTASPGNDKEGIIEVCQNLFIEGAEVRSDHDADVAPYVQSISMDVVPVALPEEYTAIQKILKECHGEKVKEIRQLGYLNTSSSMISKTELLRLQGALHGEIAKGNKDFNILKSISLAAEATKVDHAIEMLESQGVEQAFGYMEKLQQQAATSTTRAVKNLVEDSRFKTALAKMRTLVEQHSEHPKMEALKTILHKQQEKGSKRIIIFTNYRDTASKIKKMLDTENISSEIFVGQAKKKGIGLSQKQQKQMLIQFSEGVFTALIATSVAEEGIDIPSVDHVIFYEPIPSAIRHIQRRGRTGRLEKGGVIMLMAKGTRDEAYRWSAIHKEKRMQRNMGELKNVFKQLEIEHLLGQKEKKHDELLVDSTGNDVVIMVDDREKSSKIVKEFLEKNIKVRLRRLEAGDFVLSARCAVEFKTVPDFVDSIIDGRLLSQLIALKTIYDRPLLIVEGEEDIYSQRSIHPNAIRGMLSTITVTLGVPILYTKNAKDTAAILAVTARREQMEGMKNGTLHSKKPLTTKEQQEYVIASLPGIGPKLSKPLLERFGSIKNIMNASIPELQTVEKIGEKKAKEIQRVLGEGYTRE
ncbi:MAG: DEAD/DEAH box helicase [Candidatus Woesearchaeota archaeon]|nr:DEAD/DEAH box helicase [Candidatus Woesearchaeota archaeon]